MPAAANFAHLAGGGGNDLQKASSHLADAAAENVTRTYNTISNGPAFLALRVADAAPRDRALTETGTRPRYCLTGVHYPRTRRAVTETAARSDEARLSVSPGTAAGLLGRRRRRGESRSAWSRAAGRRACQSGLVGQDDGLDPVP
jgi:hypothetical protein